MRCRRPGGALDDRGSATAELAVALPAVAVLLLAVLGVVHAVSVRWECADGARAGARSAALGEPDAVVVQTARRAAGGSAAVSVVRDGQWVTVTVAQAVTGWDAVPLDVQAHAVARSEP